MVTSRASQGRPWPWPGARGEVPERTDRIGQDLATNWGTRTDASWTQGRGVSEANPGKGPKWRNVIVRSGGKKKNPKIMAGLLILTGRNSKEEQMNTSFLLVLFHLQSSLQDDCVFISSSYRILSASVLNKYCLTYQHIGSLEKYN